MLEAKVFEKKLLLQVIFLLQMLQMQVQLSQLLIVGLQNRLTTFILIGEKLLLQVNLVKFRKLEEAQHDM
jgi:hypothetical protein